MAKYYDHIKILIKALLVILICFIISQKVRSLYANNVMLIAPLVLINNLDMDAILVRYEFDNLIIADQQQGKIDYDKLNEIIEAYSKIDSYHKDIIYIPFYLYNIDLSITLSYPITAENNLITAINKAKDVTLYVRYSNELDEKSNSSILNIIEQVANKNGTLDINQQKLYLTPL